MNLLLQKRKLKIDYINKKWEIADKRNGLPLRDRKHDLNRAYLLERLHATEKFIKKN